MEVNEIVEHIFGPKCHLPDNPQDFSDEKLYCLDWVNQWVSKTLIELEGPCLTPETEDLRNGRIGPRVVRFDITTHVGLFIVGIDRLTLHSQSNFSTIRANVCLYKGKWQYEMQLGSKGVMQIGWATSACKFSQEIGVGDTINSYAYDGNRIRKWNVSTHKYGEPWLSGDIIGCTIDLDRGSLEFYRNGRSLGEAFDNIQMGPGMAYFPSVSLAFTENLVANFGATPFRYPVEGFQPIQEAPSIEFIKADQLTKWLLQLLNLYDRKYELSSHIHSGKSAPAGSSSTNEAISHQALLMGLSRVLVHPLATLLLSPYVTEACLLPFLQNLCGVENTLDGRLLVANKRKLMVFLDMIWAFLEEFEIQRCLEALIVCLLSNFRHVSFELEYPHQKKSLLLLIYLTQHPKTRKHLLEHILFDRVRFANFVHVKPLDEGGLADVVNTPWWEPINDEKIKQAYNSSCQRIKEAIAHIETLQVELLKTLLDNTDGNLASPSSRKIFLRKFRIFLKEHAASSRGLSIMQTPLPITLCCFHRLLVTFRALWEKEVGRYPIVIPSRIFYDSSVNYFSIDRLGGVLSHLNKTLKADLVRALGSEHPAILALDKPPLPVQQYDLDASSFLAGTSLSLGPRFQMASTSTGASPSTNTTSQAITSSITTATSTTNSVANPTPLAAAAAAAVNAPPNGTVNTADVAANTSTTSTSTSSTQPTGSQVTSGLNTISGGVGMLVERISDRADSTRTKAGTLDAEMSLVELLDGLVMFYHISAHKQIAKVSMLRDSMAEYIAALTDTRSRLDSYQSTSNSEPDRIAEELQRACTVFEEKLSEQSRHMAWVRAAVYSADKQSHLAWLLRVVLQSVKFSSLDGQLFSYLPDFYLDALVELCTAIRSYVHPTASIENIEGYEDLLIEVSEFLCEHFADPRIVHANSKDTMIQALANFVCAQNTLQALEKVPYASRLSMVRALLRPYENRAWAQSNWVLVRVWQGCGFGFRYHRSPHLARKLGPKLLHNDTSLISQSIKPCPSPLFQSHVKELMLSDEPLASAFLNSLLNQLNWAFSEFIGMLQEIQNVSNRPERVFIESRQLKICATCFDLALALLRVLEMVASISRPIFTEKNRPSSELLLSRLCQLLCQVLNRVSSQSGCFQHVVLLEIPDLETVDHFPILTAVIGILIALLGSEIDHYNEGMDEVPQVAKALLTEPSFQLSSLYFVLGDLKKVGYSRVHKPFSFYNYTEDVNENEIDRVLGMLRLLEACQTHLSESKTLSEDETCTICYAYPNEAIFKPCNHQSCRSCIAHHLMNSRDCFFCKTPILSVVDEGGIILHNLEKSNLSTNV